ncbi:MAG TPA: HXXEE domain-containing protein [Gammaproteobacteria bacterium]|nr:HXXEE domain-containing protein [Gammaproteobacteria bacterium]
MSPNDDARALPPQLLQIVREPIKPGNEAAYEVVEDETARACVELDCPHPHLALETLAGPKVIWWLNFFASETERLRVTDDYLRNQRLMEVLIRNNERKAKLTEKPMDMILRHRPGRGAPFEVAGTRFVVVTIAAGPAPTEGESFEAPDGSYFVLQAAKSRAEAERLAADRPRTTILAVRPSWGLPAKGWLDADRKFWAANPLMRRGKPRGLARWWPLALPSAYALHLAEEWYGGEGLVAWTERVLGTELTPLRFVILNAVAWPLFAALTVLAIRFTAYAWLLVTFATIVVVNALLHALGTLAVGVYSPGLVTGLLLYVPVGGLVLVTGRHKLPPRRFGGALLLGVAIHVAVAFIAFA